MQDAGIDSNRQISMRGGYGLDVGRGVRRPPRATLRRLRRRIAEYLDHEDASEWDSYEFVRRNPPERGVDEKWAELEVWQAIVQRPEGNGFPDFHLACAWVEVGDVDKALEHAGREHREAPDDLETAELIVKLLVLQGRDYTRFPWVRAPRVADLDASTRQRCFDWLEAHGRIADSFDLCWELFGDEVLLFEDEELAEFLGQDARFAISRVDDGVVIALRDVEPQA